MRTNANQMLKAAAVLGMMFALAGRAQADFVVNGGFETGDFTGFTATGDASIATGSPGANPDVHSGQHAAILGSAGTLSQTIATIVGHTYIVSYFLRNTATQNDFASSFGSGPDSFNLFQNVFAFPYQQIFLTGVATSTSTPLTFTFQNQGHFSLDDITITDTSVTPAPSSMSLAGLVVLTAAGAAWVSRRQLAA